MINRRLFIKSITIIGAAVIVLPRRVFSAGSFELELDKIKDLKTIGGTKTLEIKGHKVLFIRDTESTIRALDPTCTHKGCMVEYNNISGKIKCPCHKSEFDIEGKNIKGPAEKPLKSFKAILRDDNIIFSLD